MIIIYEENNRGHEIRTKIMEKYLKPFGYNYLGKLFYKRSDLNGNFAHLILDITKSHKETSILYLGLYGDMVKLHEIVSATQGIKLNNIIIGFTDFDPNVPYTHYSNKHYIVTPFYFEYAPIVDALKEKEKISGKNIFTYSSILLYTTFNYIYLSTINSIDTEEDSFRTSMVSTIYNSFLGEFHLGKNHFSYQNLLSLTFDENGKPNDIVKISGYYMSTPFDGIFNDNKYRNCDFINDSSDKEKDAINIGIFTSYGSNRAESKTVLMGIFVGLHFLDINGGVKGIPINPIFCNEQDENKGIENCILLFKNNKVQYIFGGFYQSIISQGSSLFDAHNMLYYYPSDSTNSNCPKNVFRLLQPYNDHQIVPNLVTKIIKTEFIIIYTLRESTIHYYNDLVNELKIRGFTPYSVFPISDSKLNFEETLNAIVNMFPNGITIISFLKGKYTSELLQNLYKLNLSSEYFTVMSFFIDILEAKGGNNIDYMRGHYFFSINTYDIKNDPYNYGRYHQMALPYVDYYYFPILLSFTSLSLFYESYSPISVDATIELSYRKEFETVYGKTRLFHTNSFYCPVRIVYIKGLDSNNELVLDVLYAAPLNMNSIFYTPFDSKPDEYLMCNWDDMYSQELGEMIKLKGFSIGFIIEVEGDRYDLSGLEGIIGAVTDINGQSGMFEYYLKVYVFDESLTDDEIDSTGVFFGCKTAECRELISKRIYPKPLFFYNFFQGEECIKNVFYIGGSSQLLIEPMISYLIEYYIDIPILNIFDSKDDFSKEQTRIVISYAADTLQIYESYDINGKKLFSIIQNIQRRCLYKSCMVIINVNSDRTEELLELFNRYSLEKSLYMPICTTLISTKMMEIDRNLVENSFFAMDLDMEEYNQIHLSSSIISGSMTISSLFYSTYIALNLLSSIFDKWDFTDLESNLKLFYDASYKINENTYYISYSNYMNKPFFFYTFRNGQITNLFKQNYDILPLGFVWDEINTPDRYKLCDFSGNPNDDPIKYPSPYVPINGLLSLTGKFSYFSDGVFKVIEFVVNEYNKKKGILDKHIGLFLYDDESNKEVAEDIVEYLSGFDIPTLFIVSGREITEVVISLLISTNIFLLNMGYATVDFCENNILQSGNTITLYNRLFDILLIRDYSAYGIIAPIDDVQVDYVIKYLRRKEATIFKILYDSSSIDESYLSGLLHSIKREFKMGCIIYMGDLQHHVLLNKALKDAKMLEPAYHVVSLSTADDAVMKGVDPFEAATPYYMDLDLEENKKFKTNIFKILRSGTPITPRMTGAYQLLKIVFETIYKAPNYGEDFYKQIYLTEIEGPEGLLKIENNNILSRYMSLVQLNPQTRKFDLVYGEKIRVKPAAWGWLGLEPAYDCDFQVNSENKKKRLNTVVILGLFDLTGPTAELEKSMLMSAEMAVYEINENGGIFGSILVLDVKDTMSDESEFISGLESTVDSIYKAIFGGLQGNMYELSSDIISIPFFFVGINFGDLCLENSFVMNFQIQQAMKQVEWYLVKNVKPLFLLSGMDKISQEYKNRFINIINSLRISLSGERIITDFNNEQISDDIYSSLPHGGIIFNSIWDFKISDLFNRLCSDGIVYPDFQIITIGLFDTIVEKINTNCLSTHIVIAPFFESINNKSLNSQYKLEAITSNWIEKYKEYAGDIKPLDYMLPIVYDSVKVWYSALMNTGSFGSSDLKNFFYGRSISTTSGEIIINTNNFVSRKLYIARIVGRRQYQILYSPEKLLYAESYSYLSSNFGKECDWSEADRGDGYIIPIKKILFIHESDENEIGIEYSRMLSENAIVQGMNDDGGMDGYKIIPIHIFYNVRYGQLLKSIRQSLFDNDIIAIVGCITSQCSNIVSDAVLLTGPLFFDISPFSGKKCEKYTVYIQPGVFDLSSVVVEFFSSKAYVTNYVYISSMEDYDSDVYNRLVDLTAEKGSSMKGYCSINFLEDGTASNPNITKCLEAVLTEAISNNHIILMINLVGKNTGIFLDALYRSKIPIQKIQLFFFFYEPSILSEELTDFIQSQFVVSTIGDRESPIYIGLKILLKTTLGDTYRLSQDTGNIHTSLDLLKNGIEISSKFSGEWPNSDYIRLALINNPIDSISGRIKINNKNYIETNFYIEYILGDETAVIYPNSGTYRTIKLESIEIFIPSCRFGKNQINYKNDALSIILGSIFFAANILTIFFSLFYIFKYMETDIIRYAIPVSLELMLFAAAILSIVLYLNFMFSPIDSSALCIIRQVTIPLAICFYEGTIFAKILRISKLMNNKNLKKVCFKSNLGEIYIFFHTEDCYACNGC